MCVYIVCVGVAVWGAGTHTVRQQPRERARRDRGACASVCVCMGLEKN